MTIFIAFPLDTSAAKDTALACMQRVGFNAALDMRRFPTRRHALR
ncbi:hypothetical protein [Pseudoxanthomonas composti]|nr:hypothetical protein [Pseudoxanthomonas composti]